MKIGIIVAMSKELNLLLPLLSDKSELTVNDIVFHCGTLHDKDVVVMQCGIGKVNAAIGALTMIDNFGPDLIINSGVAGGTCLLYTSPSPRDLSTSRMPSSA